MTKSQFPIKFQVSSIIKMFVISTDTTLVESGEIPFSDFLKDPLAIPLAILGMTGGVR